MIIFKLTVGPEPGGETGAKRPYLEGGRGPGRGETVRDRRPIRAQFAPGLAVGEPGGAVADYGKR